jgi:formamidopyrimidine-DNA glycosylase
MIELPESITLAKQINENLIGKKITAVTAAASPHKFAWYFGDPADYASRLVDREITSALGLGIFVEVCLSHTRILFSDGVNLRWHTKAGPIPKKHQLLLAFDDGTSLSASIAMYGGIQCWEEGNDFDNPYYKIAMEKPSPLTDEFDQSYFTQLLSPEEVQKLSLKAALATEQRIPGLGNGSLQDILWKAKLNPRQKTNTLTKEETNRLYINIKETFFEMAHSGGRSTEKDLFGEPGGYQVVMCAANKDKPCPECGSLIQKESYMGGSVYTCADCQPLA